MPWRADARSPAIVNDGRSACHEGHAVMSVKVRPEPKDSVSGRKHIESCESFVIQERWPDSRRVTDVDDLKSQTLRPQPIAISERSYRGGRALVEPLIERSRYRGVKARSRE
jgi:hypothetical protein